MEDNKNASGPQSTAQNGSKRVIVQINDVHKTYQLGETTVRALQGLRLQIKEGDFTALIGASGSGKTTLLNLIGCLDDVDQGEIIIDGSNVKNLTEDEKSELRNHKIGFIFQSFNLIPVLNVFENVEMPLTLQANLSQKDREQRVYQALKDVGLENFPKHSVEKLSGGQRQRVAIARALVTHPSLILADEPTANLDSNTAHMIIDLLMKLNQERQVTFFFCSHDEKLIGRVGKVVRIKDGVIDNAH